MHLPNSLRFSVKGSFNKIQRLVDRTDQYENLIHRQRREQVQPREEEEDERDDFDDDD